MNPREIDVRPGDRTSLTLTTELEGVTTHIRLRWFPRARRWCCDLVDATDASLSLPQLVQPGGRHAFDPRDPRLPPGALEWRGPDHYGRADLGETLLLFYLPYEAPSRPSVNALLRVTP